MDSVFGNYRVLRNLNMTISNKQLCLISEPQQHILKHTDNQTKNIPQDLKMSGGKN